MLQKSCSKRSRDTLDVRCDPSLIYFLYRRGARRCAEAVCRVKLRRGCQSFGNDLFKVVEPLGDRGEANFQVVKHGLQMLEGRCVVWCNFVYKIIYVLIGRTRAVFNNLIEIILLSGDTSWGCLNQRPHPNLNNAEGGRSSARKPYQSGYRRMCWRWLSKPRQSAETFRFILSRLLKID